MKRFLGVAIGAVILCLALSCGSDNSGPTGPASSPTVQSPALVTGMWWTEITHDTTTDVTDSNGAQVIYPKQTTETHTRMTVVGTSAGISGATLYLLAKSDTTYTNGTPGTTALDTITLSYNDGRLSYVAGQLAAFGRDSLVDTVYRFPMSVGSTWNVLSDSADTGFDTSVQISPALRLRVPVRAFADINGTADVQGIVGQSFGGSSRSCFNINTEVDGSARVLSDTTITVLTVPLVTKGDTAVTAVSHSSTSTHLSTDFTIPLWTHSISTEFDTLLIFEALSHHDTTISETQVVSLFDKAREDTITLAH